MKFKLLSLSLVFSANVGLEAVVLTNGANVDQKTAQTTWNAIKYLKDEDLGVLSLTLHACQQYKGNIPACINGTPDFSRNVNESRNDMVKAQMFKIADENGDISNDTCKVLCAALLPAFRKAPNCAPSPGFFWGIGNPISYKNYFSRDYWFPKK